MAPVDHPQEDLERIDSIPDLSNVNSPGLKHTLGYKAAVDSGKELSYMNLSVNCDYIFNDSGRAFKAYSK